MAKNINTDEQALKILDDVADALDQLTVSGRKNCLIVVATQNDIESVRQYLCGRQGNDQQIEQNETGCFI